MILKIYAGLPLAILGRWRSLVAAAAIMLATVPVLPWATYINEFALISQRLADQSKLTLPMGFLLLVSPLVLAASARRRARARRLAGRPGDLAVPAVLLRDHRHAGREQDRAGPDRAPVPGNGLLALGALAIVTLSHGDRGCVGLHPPPLDAGCSPA